MRNLFLFLVKNYYFFLFLFLESIAILLLVRNNSFQRASFINSSNAISGHVYETWSGFTDYLHLRQTNELLAKENADLRNELKNSLVDYSARPVQVNDTVFKQKYFFISAKVVNNSVDRQTNYLTLNRGANQGVKRLMGVICGEGVVGIVQEVSDNFCTVRSVLHRRVNVPAMLKKYGENSMVNWDGRDQTIGRMDRVPSQLKVVKGDTVVTSPYSTIFPEGIMIGTVEEITPEQGKTFNDFTVRYSTPFSKLSYVYIVNNIFQEEQTKLEEETLSKDKPQ